MKTYCTCTKNDYVCRGLWQEPETFRGDILWVHAKCCLPFRLYWERYIRRCEGCLKEICLPWETFCQKCFKLEFENTRPYNGLRAASERACAILHWPLPSVPLPILGSLVDSERIASDRSSETVVSLEI